MGRRRAALAKREANGRIQREHELAPVTVRRLRDAALTGLRDPEWGTELGRLYLAGKLTSEAYAAGKRWRELAARYSRALCSPSPDPKAIAMERSGSSVIDPDTPEGAREARRHVRAVASFIDAHVALKAAGRGSEVVVRGVCERDETIPGHQAMLALSQGLNALAGFWGLTNQNGRMSDRQAK